MTTINRLTGSNILSSGDQIPIYSAANGDARRISANALANYLSTQVTAVDKFITQYAAPTAAGFSVLINGNGSVPASVWLIMTPPSALASGAIVLPEISTCFHGQEILFNTTQPVTSFGVNPNGGAVIGAPNTLIAGSNFRLKFDSILKTWYRVN